MHPSDYVHEYTTGSGKRRYLVAAYRDGRYYAPQRADVCKLTGCYMIWGPLDYVRGNAYTYSRRGDALNRAANLYYLERETA